MQRVNKLPLFEVRHLCGCSAQRRGGVLFAFRGCRGLSGLTLALPPGNQSAQKRSAFMPRVVARRITESKSKSKKQEQE